MKKIHKVPSKSKKGVYRYVRVFKENGEYTFKCSCPANVFYRVTDGRSGKENCRHIKIIKERIKKLN